MRINKMRREVICQLKMLYFTAIIIGTSLNCEWQQQVAISSDLHQFYIITYVCLLFDTLSIYILCMRTYLRYFDLITDHWLITIVDYSIDGLFAIAYYSIHGKVICHLHASYENRNFVLDMWGGLKIIKFGVFNIFRPERYPPSWKSQ